MTDDTQPEALRLANVCSNLTRYSMDAHLIAAELRRQHTRIAELEAALFAYASEFEPNSDGDPDVGSIHTNIRAMKAKLASIGANAGEPVAWMTFTEEGDPDMVFLDRLEACQYCEDDDPPKPLYLVAPPAAQAEGWQSIETAPKEGVFLVYMQDEVRPARRMQVANWHPNVKIVGGLFAFDCAKGTHWMPLPPPPTSAKGVEHG